jgi:hypothetical protein
MTKEFDLGKKEVMQRIDTALATKQPFSLVRVGDGENLIMSQDTVMSMADVLQERWAQKANSGLKGVKLPNLALRDLMISSIQRASVVGILPPNDTTIQAPGYLKRELTDRILTYFQIQLPQTCHACINRELVLEQEFWEVLRGKNVLLIYQFADQLRSLLEQAPYHLNITLTIPFSHYNQLTPTLGFIKSNQHHFDVALICAGVNAVVLAQKVAELAGKVGIDFGKASNILIKGTPN